MRSCLLGCILVAVFTVTGCQSTPSLSKSIGRDSNLGAEIAWKKSPAAPSTAIAQEQWPKQTNPQDPVRTVSHQAQPAPKGEPKTEWMPPIPEVMVKDKPESTVPVVMPGHGIVKREGKHHGKAVMPLPNAPNELNPVALPSYVIRPADVLTIELLPQFSRDKKDQLLKSEKLGLNQPIYGPHPVHQDGNISLGIYGLVPIAGKTVTEAREEIAKAIYRRLNPETLELKDVLYNLKVDITNYNNGFYYVIVNYAGARGGVFGGVAIGEVVERFPVTGTETVLDAISKVKGVPGMVSPTRIWVARANPLPHGPDNILPVDWKGISQHGAMASNWQLLPGDRVYMQSYPMSRFDNNLARILTPFQRMIGVAQGINSLTSGNNTNLVAPPPP